MAKLNKEDIKKIIPHREPFLMVDEIVEVMPGKNITGIKHVREDEYYFKGHFPGNPIMPGVLMVEAIAQVGAVSLLMLPENKGKLALFAGIDKVRFKKLVKPGDDLEMQVEMLQFRRNIGKAKGVAKVGSNIACSAEIMFAIQ
ncbi:MAG: 3-hydroxyacyl-ACP dehydratase FabZ [Actinomycetota bacterium]